MSVIPWSIILDPQRLRELRELDILDTRPEQSYDDLADIARMICETPVANVTMVAQDRQWFKSHLGNELRETPIEQSVCAHALAESNILVINDLTEDDRTRSNALVTGEARLRFYAGVPLRLDTSFGVGTLCVLDTKPHPNGLTSAQADALKALGRQATILLKIRRFLAARDDGAVRHAPIDQPLEEISDALITAHKLNKLYDDKLLDSLLTSALTHLARRIAQSGKAISTSVH